MLRQHRVSLAFLALYSTIMLALMSPLATTGIRSSTVMPESDPAQPIWALGYVAHWHNWFHLGGPLFTDAIYFPHGLNVLANTTSFGLAILFLPVTLLLGPMASFNVIMFAGPVVSGAAMMWALRRHVDSSVFRGLAGLVWGFSPFTMEAFYWGWPNFVVLVAPPLMLWFFTELLHNTFSPRKLGLVLGVALSLQITVGAEVAALCLVGCIGTIVIAGTGYLVARRQWPGQLSWERLRKVTLWSGVGFAPLGLPVVGFATQGPAHLASWVWHDAFIKSPHSWGALVSEPVVKAQWDPFWFPVVPSHFFFGWPAVVGIAVAIVVIRHSLVRVMGVLALLGLWFMRGEAALLNPLSLLWHLPVVRNIFSSRFIIFTWFAAAVILAVGLQELTKFLADRHLALRTRGVVVAVLLVTLLVQPIHAIVATGTWDVQSSRRDAGLTEYAHRGTEPRVVMTYPAVKSSASMIQQATEGLTLKLVGGWGPQTGFSRSDDAAASYLIKAQHWLLPLPQRRNIAAVNDFIARRHVDAIIIPRQLTFPLKRGYMQPYQMVALLTYMYGSPAKLADTWIWERPHDSQWHVRSTTFVLTERQWRRCAWGVGRFNPDGVPFCVNKALEAYADSSPTNGATQR